MHGHNINYIDIYVDHYLKGLIKSLKRSIIAGATRCARNPTLIPLLLSWKSGGTQLDPASARRTIV